jgi:hypothetical protein
MKYPLFRFKCNYDIFYSKWFHWTQTINITFEANDNLTQISAELWQIRLYSIYPDCGEPEKILNSIENITPPNIAANEPYLVKCKPGFKLVGNELLKCLGCIEVKPCNIPETNNSLKVVISKLLTFNNNNITNIMADDQSYATYYCDNEEQILKGKSVKECINGLWVPDSDIFCENRQISETNVSLIIIIIVILIFLILILIITIVIIIRNKNKRKFDDNNQEKIDDNYDDAFPDIEFYEYSEVKYTKTDEYLEILDDNYECINYEDLSQTNDCIENPTYLEIT